jgi:hypothetical protein
MTMAASLLMAAAPVAAVDDSSFVSEVNTYRTKAGSPVAHLDALIDKVSVERAGQLAADGALSHDLDYVGRRFAQLGVCWQGMGEIIASNGSSDPATFVRMWDGSAPHKAIMLDPTFTAAGGSWSRGSNGGYYAVMLFVDPCGDAGFTDIGSSAFVNDIAWLVNADITRGCDTNRYCPRDPVSRAQMASFLERATATPAASRDWFRDDNTSMHEADINRVATAGITHGCDTARYCPGRDVSRGQMASFLARALDLPPATRDWFADDAGSIHQSAINQLAEAGITGGCDTRRFCPDAMVSREQMAAFLHRAFGG